MQHEPATTAPPPIWVITLAESKARQAFVRSRFDELGIPFEFVLGANGSALTPQERASYSRTRSLLHLGRGLTQGELGCSLAHLRLYERMVMTGTSAACICEDDVAPTGDLLDVIRDLQPFPRDWDVITLCSQFPESAGPAPIAAAPLVNGRQICTYRRTPFGTQCYVIRLHAARRLLDVGFPVCMPTDELLFRRHPAGLRLYGVEPRPVAPIDLGSELEARPDPPRKVSIGARCLEEPVVWTGKALAALRRKRDRFARRR